MSARTTGRHAARRHAARRGITLVEIVLALAITGLITSGVASLMYAVAGGTKDRQELRRRNVRVEVLAARLDGAIRSSGMAVGRDGSCLVLWVADTKRNNQPDLAELRRIEWDSATKRLLCYEAPATLADADNSAYDLALTDFLTITAALRGSASFPATVWANNVSGWSTSPAAVTPTTRMIAYGVTIDTTGGTHSVRSAATLRGTPGNNG